jgi:hypothetical protein
MAVDIRATVTCSLGTLISGSVSDDYLQGNGLIRTRGSAVISGTITPAIGTIVTFSYTKGGVTRNLPRKLRVLSSFADPYRRTTSVELGCKLTYLADLRPSVNWSVFNDPNNSTYNEDDSKIVTLPIWSSSVMNECLAQLGISASSIPVTNNFSIGSFDFSSGYVNVLSDILVSECYCGYLDYNEVLQIINLSDNSGTGPVYAESSIIDHGPINSGQLPGEAVTVSYSTLKLKPPDPAEPTDERERRNWERESSTTGPNFYYIGNKVYSGMEMVKTTITYRTIGDVDVPIRRESIERGSTAKVAGSLGTAYVTNGIGFNAVTTELRREIEKNEYDKEGNRTRSEVSVFENTLAFYGSLSLDYVFPGRTAESRPSFITFPSTGTIRREKTITNYRRIGTAEQQITRTYAAWLVSTPGQQAIAENRANLNTRAAVQTFLDKVAGAGLVQERTIVTINTRNTIAGRPRSTAAAALAKKGDPTNNYRQQSTSQLQLALGSGAAQRRIEFSMPYAPDDFFNGPSGGPFTSYPSDAPTKANNFGRVQNRLLLGNRNGMNLQLAPEVLPAAPFAPMYVQANGLTAQYRANGNQWSFDSNGIVCSTDALFWAAVGGTGTFWFPVAPGITTLPATPAPVGGNITPGITIPPYNELVEVRAVVGPVLRVTSFPYSLQTQLTTLDRLTLHTKLRAARIKKVEIPAAGITVAGLAPTVIGSSTISPAALILHFDGTTFVDSSTNGYTVTANGNATLSATQSKFGGKAAALDGNNGLVTVTGANLALGTGNWTVQAWIRLNAGNFDERAVVQFGTGFGDPGLYIYPSGGNNLIAWLDDGLQFEALSNPVSDATWVHVLASKQGSIVRVFVNGIKSSGDYTISGSTTTSNITTTTVQVGGAEAYAAIFDGYIDDVVIEPGRVVNANFTPPTTAYPNP